jgi:tripartite-type tricarboxylate transporter receptor subunit TctC
MRFADRAMFASIVAAAIGLLLPNLALCQTPYYTGKTITIIRGGGTGGSGEFQTRAVIPALKKYIPGNPTIVLEFMDGAAGRKGANYIYTTKPDGLKIGSRRGDDPWPHFGLAGQQLRYRQIYLHWLHRNWQSLYLFHA